ncbi:hypothetical protein [Georgenia alba]|uniref:DUF317 domain-containing protein n=1 Tax=Georgenia alba TaxID=2233858 RepID=A0ABW2QFR4_9MICO
MGRPRRAPDAPRAGPTLTAVLWDPARGTADLRAATEDAAVRSRLPTTVDGGPEHGLVHWHVWVGGLGLGLPEDREEDWTDLGLAVGAAVDTVDPALALAAPEWGAGSLAAPDPGELAPGLHAGRARRRDLDAARVGRFTKLAERQVVRADDDGWVWAADGAVPLWTAPRVEAARLVPAVFHAWWGRRPDQEAPELPRSVLLRGPEDAPGSSPRPSA